MTKEEARIHLISGADPDDPMTWEAYLIFYGERHSNDPEFDDGGANDDRIYKSTPQTFDTDAYPRATFETPFGMANSSPYKLDAGHYADETTANMLAEKLGGETRWKEPPASGPFQYPGSWYLSFGKKKLLNAGRVGEVWNRAREDYVRLIRNWNLNLGANNRAADPSKNTPVDFTLRKINLELKRR
jgi:hypothetical protein